jgi:hypothetical protein
MPRVVTSSDFSPVSDILQSPSSVFIIPTFQRPYAWAENQLDDLYKDIIKAKNRATSNSNLGYHYLSPIHLISIKPSNKELYNYIHFNEDVKLIFDSQNFGSFVNYENFPLDIYLVIDGQQRLTTLYFLFHFLYRYLTLNPLYISINANSEIISIPRLIQNPEDDHSYMKRMLKHILEDTPFSEEGNTQAQRRMQKAVANMQNWDIPSLSAFIKSPYLQSILITLDPGYGLTSFLTLNDRGRDLTELEKFKALLLEYDLNENSGQLASSIHHTFGDLYRLLDQSAHSGLFPEGDKGDDALMQCLSTYIRIRKDADAPDQGAEAAYRYFRDTLGDTLGTAASGRNVGSILAEWLNAIDEIRPQIGRLNDYLLGSIPQASLPSPIYPGRTVRDDYNIVIRSLGLSYRSLSILFKFRNLHPNVEWHERLPMQCTCDPRWVQPLFERLDQISGAALDSGDHTLIDPLIQDIRQQIPDCFALKEVVECKCETSILEVVERMELFLWSRGYRPRGSFRDQWNVVFGSPLYTAHDVVVSWYNWTWYQGDFPRFVQDNHHETIFRYILREYEAEISGSANIHFADDLQLEHIFPQNPDPLPPNGYGFGNNSDIYRTFLNRIGNLTFAPTPNNQSWSAELPQAKASHYFNLLSPEITRRVGMQLLPIGANLTVYRLALDIRCTELAVFSLKRFNAQCMQR